jgi:DNA repair exonuclease SbcCD ATPase subunit
MEAAEKDAAISAALAEFSRIVQAVASSLIANALDEETRKAIEATRENAPDAVSKSLTDTQAQVADLTKSLEAKQSESEAALSELADVKKSLEEKETEIEKLETRKTIAFDKFGSQEAETPDAKQITQAAQTKFASFIVGGPR